MPYKLSASLSAHSSDVRAVVSPTDSIVLSASRDTTAISWTRESPLAPFAQASVYRAGSRFINAVTYLPASAEAPNGLIVTGGQDTVINVFALGSDREEPMYSLLGHSENVCALDARASGVIVSGSWDKTARVWKNFQLAIELQGHDQAVWAVLAVDEDTFLTGSADKTIRLWVQHKAVRTFQGHKDAVRGLALVPDLGFASCSNDSEVRVWTTEGDVIYTLSGHTSFVYSLSVLPNGNIVSGGEDRTVRVWKDGECVQTIVHPAISVWSVSSMPNGDIVSGASDGIVRVFSTSEERWAPAEELKKYEGQIATQALPSQQVGDVKKSDLPGLEALSTPGKKMGEVKMVRNGDKIEAHQWDTITSSWQKVGEVVDAVGPGRKQLFEGKEYDYVFDVDIKDGTPPLKLPYNITENPYNAAQRFLASNDLPPGYIDEVVRFIEKNTEGVNLSANADFVDPYTGASRYTASSTSVPTTGPYGDPFTGSSRYTPSNAPATSAPTSVPQGDPFTGGSRYTPAATSSSPSTVILPVRTFLSFKQANVPAMRGKLHQVHESFENEISAEPMALYPDELKAVDVSLAFLTQAVASPSAVTESTLNNTYVETVEQILERWPPSIRFPVIDLGRLLSGYCPQAYSGPGQALRFFRSILFAAEWEESWETPLPKYRDTNILLALRALANGFQDSVSPHTTDWAHEIFQELAKAPYAVLSKVHRVTLATILFNFSCVRLKGPVSPSVSTSHLSLISRILREEEVDAETVYRAVVGLGNTVYASKSEGGNLVLESADLRRLIDTAAKRFPEQRVRSLVNEIKKML